jgi:hypothetical protein
LLGTVSGAYAAVAVNISIGRAVVKILSMRENRKENPAIAQSRYGSLSMKYKTKTTTDGMRDDSEILTALLIAVRRLSLMRAIPMFSAPCIGFYVLIQ